VDADCAGNDCHPVTLLCVPNCFDGIINGGETDPDCGGPCSQKCPNGGHCTVASDCVSGHCDASSHCIP
jgi:hypothetical protein